MPTFKALSREELTQMKPTREPKPEILAPYREFLSKKEVGEGGEVEPTGEETVRAVKRRLTVAAQQLGKTIKYRKSPEGKIIFEVVEPKPAGTRSGRKNAAS